MVRGVLEALREHVESSILAAFLVIEGRFIELALGGELFCGRVRHRLARLG